MPIFILGATSDPDRLWIADTDAGTIKPAEAAGTGSDTGGADIAAIQKLRRNGYVVTRDVDVAVSVENLAQPPSHQFTE